MPFYGTIVTMHPVMDSSGSIDKSIFRLVSSECLVGRGQDCDIRVQLPKVSNLHCSVSFDQIKRAVLTCLSRDHGTTKVNSKVITYGNALVLNHKDIFSIGDRSFRWEYPKESQYIDVDSPKKDTPKTAANGSVNRIDLLAPRSSKSDF